MRDLIARLLRAVLARQAACLSLARPYLVAGLRFGRGTRIQTSVRFRVTDGGECRLGHRVTVERFAEITASGGAISMGNDVFIGQGSVIVAKVGIHLGDDCLIAERVSIRDQNHVFRPGARTREAGFTCRPVRIGANVWIGAGSVVLAGVSIGDNCVVGAGSVVTHSFGPDLVVAGNPARILRPIAAPSP